MDYDDLVNDLERRLWRSPGGEGGAVIGGYEAASSGRDWTSDREVRGDVVRDIVLRNEMRRGLVLIGVRITGTLDLSAISSQVPIFLRNCWFEESLLLGNATVGRVDLTGSYLTAGVNGPGMRADDTLALGSVTSAAPVWLVGAQVRGAVTFNGATIDGCGSQAITAMHLTARSFLMEDASCIGGVSLRYASIDGPISFSGANLDAGQQTFAIDASNVTVGGDCSCQQSAASGRSFRATGIVSLRDAHIKGSINFASATLIATENDAEKATAFVGDRVKADAGIRMRNSFTAVGLISLNGARIGGHLDLTKAALRATPYALTADGAEISGSAFLRCGFDAIGSVRLTGVEVGDNISFDGATLRTASLLPALEANDLDASSMLLRFANAPKGAINISGSSVKTFADELRTWPAAGLLFIDGFRYDEIVDAGSAAARLAWIRRNPHPYVPQVYDELATMFEASGDSEAARDVRIAKQRRRRSTPGWSHIPGRLWSAFLRVTVGYGYQPSRVIPWFALLLGIGTVLFASPLRDDVIATNEAAKAQTFYPFLYTADLLLPVASLGTRAGWTPINSAQWVVLLWTLVGWLLGLTLVAAVSGVFKRS